MSNKCLNEFFDGKIRQKNGARKLQIFICWFYKNNFFKNFLKVLLKTQTSSWLHYFSALGSAVKGLKISQLNS